MVSSVQARMREGRRALDHPSRRSQDQASDFLRSHEVTVDRHGPALRSLAIDGVARYSNRVQRRRQALCRVLEGRTDGVSRVPRRRPRLHARSSSRRACPLRLTSSVCDSLRPPSVPPWKRASMKRRLKLALRRGSCIWARKDEDELVPEWKKTIVWRAKSMGCETS